MCRSMSDISSWKGLRIRVSKETIASDYALTVVRQESIMPTLRGSVPAYDWRDGGRDRSSEASNDGFMTGT